MTERLLVARVEKVARLTIENNPVAKLRFVFPPKHNERSTLAERPNTSQVSFLNLKAHPRHEGQRIFYESAYRPAGVIVLWIWHARTRE
jgi:hypothetical protein